MSLHILGGRWKGRTLKAPPTDRTRPTQSILRQSVFNICQWQVPNARFLDLFAGSGAMGLEALSRGAREAVFIEQDRSALQSIRENIASLGAKDSCSILASDVFRAFDVLAKKGEPFDIVYIDPPYELGHPAMIQILILLEKERLIGPSSSIFVEESSEGPELAYESPHIRKKSTRRFGVARLLQFETIDAIEKLPPKK